MNIESTGIQGAFEVHTRPIGDERGFFYRAFCERELAEVVLGQPIRQINVSRTQESGTVRGFHFQYPPEAEIKLVRCLRGRVWDVALDLRLGSPTFLQWHAVELCSTRANLLVIPQGCAHGFQALEPDSELLYLHTAHYSPDQEGGVRYDDPRLSIPWPLPVAQVSPRDRSHPPLQADFQGIKV